MPVPAFSQRYAKSDGARMRRPSNSQGPPSIGRWSNRLECFADLNVKTRLALGVDGAIDPDIDAIFLGGEEPHAGASAIQQLVEPADRGRHRSQPRESNQADAPKGVPS